MLPVRAASRRCRSCSLGFAALLSLFRVAMSSRLYNFDLLETNRLGGVVLEDDRVLLLVELQLRRDRNPAFSFAVLVQANVDEGEGIVVGARPVANFLERHVAIGRD